MKQIIPLTKIGFFNPGRLSDEEIEQSFIARIPFFEYIFKRIAAEKPNSIPQHHLIIGQRGMGKSYLLNRVAAELRKPPYNETFIPLSFPEEQYNVDRLSKFWLNCLDALADALDKENKKGDLMTLDAEISSLSKEKKLGANQVYNAFEKWIAKLKRRPVLLVDNLNLIFSKIDQNEQHQLRAIMMSEKAPVLLGASATAIDETINYQAPFYDAFQINYLKKLTFDESIEVLQNLASITGNTNFKETIYQQRGRLEALYQLTGGTPRTLAILFPLIQAGFSDDIQTDLDALLDAITPLYKARFEELSEQLQVVMDAVALNWDPINLEKLREVTMLENAQLSPQLKRLVDIGWLQKLDAYKAKGGSYELSERFFNLWYLMRRSSRRQKRELYCLTKFLESFYGNELNEFAKVRVACKSENLNQIALDLALADAIKEKRLSKRLRNKGYDALLNISLIDDLVLKSFSIPGQVIQKKAAKLFLKGRNNYKTQKYLEAEAAFKNSISLDSNFSAPWNGLGNLYSDDLNKYQEAESAYKKAIELDDKFSYPWNGLGVLYDDLNKYQEAESSYKKAIELDNKFAYPWIGLGNLYSDHLNKYQEAESSYKKAIELDNKFAYPWIGLGNLYSDHLNKYQEAESAYKKAIELDDKNPYSYGSLGNFYSDHLNKYQEAESAYKKAIELDDKNPYSWGSLGNLYSDHLNKYQEAESAYKKAIELDDKDPYTWSGLGNLYSDHLNKYQEAESAYKKAIELDDKDPYTWSGLGNLYSDHLNKYQEAESAYKKAIQLDDTLAYPWNWLANLYSEHLNEYQQAESAYKKAIQLDDKFAYSWYGLANLYREHLNEYQEAESAYKKAIELDDKDPYTWSGLGSLYSDHLNKYQEAESAYKKAIQLDDTLAYPWNWLANLYCLHLNKYQEAESAYKKSIELDDKASDSWNGLGNIYADYLNKCEDAENAYQYALKIDPANKMVKYNLLFLWRDKMNKLGEAKDLFNTLEKTEEVKDSHLLNEALFAYYDRNAGIAEDSVKEALTFVGDNLPVNTRDDWYRSAAVTVKLGYGHSFLNVLESTGHDVIFRPLYIAIGALTRKEDDLFLNSIAVEVREPARKIMGIMKNYIK